MGWWGADGRLRGTEGDRGGLSWIEGDCRGPKGTKGTKKTHNREENVFPENSIFAKETLDEYERLAKQEGPKENVKLFMKKVYNNEEYKTRMSIPRASGSGSSTIKRGANGKNWKEEWEDLPAEFCKPHPFFLGGRQPRCEPLTPPAPLPH